MTSLHLAAREGHEDIVRVLLTRGTDPNVETMVSKMFGYTVSAHIKFIEFVIPKL